MVQPKRRSPFDVPRPDSAPAPHNPASPNPAPVNPGRAGGDSSHPDEPGNHLGQANPPPPPPNPAPKNPPPGSGLNAYNRLLAALGPHAPADARMTDYRTNYDVKVDRNQDPNEAESQDEEDEFENELGEPAKSLGLGLGKIWTKVTVSSKVEGENHMETTKIYANSQQKAVIIANMNKEADANPANKQLHPSDLIFQSLKEEFSSNDLRQLELVVRKNVKSDGGEQAIVSYFQRFPPANGEDMAKIQSGTDQWWNMMYTENGRVTTNLLSSSHTAFDNKMPQEIDIWQLTAFPDQAPYIFGTMAFHLGRSASS